MTDGTSGEHSAAGQTRDTNGDITIGPIRRRKLLRWVDYAKRSGAQKGLSHRLVQHEYKPNFAAEYSHRPGIFGDYLKDAFHTELRTRLASLGSGKAKNPFTVIRSLYPTCFFPWSVSADIAAQSPNSDRIQITNPKWFIKDFYCDIISSGLLALLDSEHRGKDGNPRISRDYFTNPTAIMDQFSSDTDLPSRFRQATPEFRLLHDPKLNDLNKAAVHFIVLACMENRIKEPIWVLPVADVVKTMREIAGARDYGGLAYDKAIETLKGDNYRVFDHWNEVTFARDQPDTQPLLSNTDGSPAQDHQAWLSFDPNRLIFASDDATNDRSQRLALILLRNAIALAGSRLTPIELKAGDALIVDNYRALLRRSEMPYVWLRSPIPRGRLPVRWLRCYHGYPPSHGAHH